MTKQKSLKWIAKLPLAELCRLHAAIGGLYRSRLAAEEKKRLKLFKIGDVAMVRNGKVVKIERMTRTKLIVSMESSPGELWRVSPIACTKQEGVV